MAFLAVHGAESASSVNSVLLESIAEGPLRRVERDGWTLWLSGVCADVEDRIRVGVDGSESGGGACLSFEAGELSVERDPLGMLPLWSTPEDGPSAFGPSARWFLALNGAEPRLRDDLDRPGPRPENDSPFENLLRLPAVQRIYTCGPDPVVAAPPFDPLVAKDTDRDLALHTESIGASLEAAVARLPEDDCWRVFLSGGVDSSSAAALIRERSRTSPRASSLGTARGDEFERAERAADLLGLELERVVVTDAELLDAFEDAVWYGETFDGLTAEVVAQLECLVRRVAQPARHVRVVTGYGADLLFGGMLEHAAYCEAVGVRTEAELVARTRWTNEVSPLFAWRHGVSLHHLFWRPEVLAAGLAIPLELNRSAPQGKACLRRAAVERGWLDQERAFGPKQALTDGTRAQDGLSAALGLEPGYNFQAKTRAAAAIWERRVQALGR